MARKSKQEEAIDNKLDELHILLDELAISRHNIEVSIKETKGKIETLEQVRITTTKDEIDETNN